jgi:hypothetical protein
VAAASSDPAYAAREKLPKWLSRRAAAVLWLKRTNPSAPAAPTLYIHAVKVKRGARTGGSPASVATRRRRQSRSLPRRPLSPTRAGQSRSRPRRPLSPTRAGQSRGRPRLPLTATSAGQCRGPPGRLLSQPPASAALQPTAPATVGVPPPLHRPPATAGAPPPTLHRCIDKDLIAFVGFCLGSFVQEFGPHCNFIFFGQSQSTRKHYQSNLNHVSILMNNPITMHRSAGL